MSGVFVSGYGEVFFDMYKSLEIWPVLRLGEICQEISPTGKCKANSETLTLMKNLMNVKGNLKELCTKKKISPNVSRGQEGEAIFCAHCNLLICGGE